MKVLRIILFLVFTFGFTAFSFSQKDEPGEKRIALINKTLYQNGTMMGLPIKSTVYLGWGDSIIYHLSYIKASFSIKDVEAICYKYETSPFSAEIGEHELVFYTSGNTIRTDYRDEVTFSYRLVIGVDNKDSALSLVDHFLLLYDELGLKRPALSCPMFESDSIAENYYYKVIANKNEQEYFGIDSKISGKITFKYPNGNLRGERNFKKGYCHGKQKDYDENGQLEYVAEYKNGLLHGSVEYYQDGKLTTRDKYANGVFLKSEESQ